MMSKESGRLLLAVDVGNTMTHYGLFNGNRLIRHWRKRGLWQKRGHSSFCYSKKKSDPFFARDPFFEAVVASVVPERKIDLGVPTLVVNHKLDLGLKIKYKNPDKVGADRLANAVAAKYLYGYPALVVDYGTAITIDVISKKGDYLGGVIMPGLDMIRYGLHERTALLPLVKVGKPKRVLGQTTKDAIQSGMYYGVRGMIRQLISDLKKELRFPEKTVIINTGGYTQIFGGRIDKFLTLKGLKIIYERNKDHRLHGL